MKKSCLLVLCLALAALAQDGKPNFSGTWELQVEKSDFGPLPGPKAQTNVVEHKDPKLKVATTAKTDQGDRTTVRNFTTDGEENTNQLGNGTLKSRAHWVENALVVEGTLEVQGNKVQIKDRWQLSDDAKTLTVARLLSSEMGEAEQKFVFDKKQQ